MQQVGSGLRAQLRAEATEDDEAFQARQRQKQQEGQDLAKILGAEHCQQLGNGAFKAKDFDKAMKMYTKALRKLGRTAASRIGVS